MNLQQFLRDYAERTRNSFIEYTDTVDVVTVSLGASRFQNVGVYQVVRNGRSVIEFLSKVCPANEYLDHVALLELNHELCYCKIVIHEDTVQVAASIPAARATDEELADIMSEVAQVADQLEFELTGQDVN